MVYYDENGEPMQQPAVQPQTETLPEPPTVAEGESNPQTPAPEEAPPPRRRGRNMPNNRNVSMGPSGRQELNVRGKRYIRDGSWWVDADALAPYGFDPDAAPPEVVEGNRMEFAQGLNRARRLNVAAFNDANWGPEAQAHGFGDWRESRRAAMQAYQADPVRVWQMAPNGGGGDTSIQPTQDDLDRFSHWLWITNPENHWQAVLGVGKPAGPPPTTDRQPPNDSLPPQPPALSNRQGPIYSNSGQNPNNRPTRPPVPLAPPVMPPAPQFNPPGAQDPPQISPPTMSAAPTTAKVGALPAPPKQFQIPGTSGGGTGMPKLKGLLG